MALDIERTADAVIAKKTSFASHVGWPLATMKTIEGKGIRHKPDVQRLTKKVMAVLNKRGVTKTGVRHADA